MAKSGPSGVSPTISKGQPTRSPPMRSPSTPTPAAHFTHRPRQTRLALIVKNGLTAFVISPQQPPDPPRSLQPRPLLSPVCRRLKIQARRSDLFSRFLRHSSASHPTPSSHFAKCLETHSPPMRSPSPPMPAAHFTCRPRQTRRARSAADEALH